MKTKLEIGGKAVDQVVRTTKTVLFVQISLVCAVVVIFSMLIKREGELHDSIRENAIWAVYQLDREARSLHAMVQLVQSFNRQESLVDAQSEITPKSLTTRYDILHSRMSILANSKYNAYFEQNRVIGNAIEKVRQQVLALEPTFDRIASQKRLQGIKFKTIEARLAIVREATNDLLVRTNTALSVARADARDAVINVQMQAFLFMIAIVLAALFFAVNMMRQVRCMRRSREELARAAMETERAYEAAEAGNKAKSAFLATIGHEIRTPLNAILGMAELLTHKPLPEEQAEYVRAINSSGKALLEMINEILDFAKMEYGADQTEECVFHLGSLVQDAVSIVETQAKERNNKLTVTTETCLRDIAVSSDPIRLKRVLLNLLSNAVKFTENGSIRVDVRAETQDGQLARLNIAVCDTGIGIAEDAQKELFTAFHQVDSSIGRRFGGTGLGLAICKQIVEDMRGSISVVSQAGQGATFSFDVPVRFVTDQLPAETGAPDAAAVDDSPLRSLHVLVVEDNLINQQVATKFLERLGQKVALADNGQAAVESVRTGTYDLVLMDLQMPVVDGITATRRIRALGGINARLPIVAMSANASGKHRRECREAGMNDFVSKPVSLQQLEALLRQYAPGEPGSDRSTVRAAIAGAVTTSRSSHRPNGVVLLPVSQSSSASDDRRRELSEEFGEEVYGELLDAFYENAEALIAEIARAQETNDTTTYQRSLHTLKGAAGNLGFSALAATAEALRAAQGETGQDNRLRETLEQEKPRKGRLAK